MNLAEEQLYTLPSLDHLQSNELSVGVPVVNGAVQIGLDNGASEVKKRLAVIVAYPEIKIAREDGELLQIEDVFASRRRPVLAQPVGALILRQAKEAGTWTVSATDELRIYDPQAMKFFLELIDSFVVHKDLQNQRNHETAAALKLLETFRE